MGGNKDTSYFDPTRQRDAVGDGVLQMGTWTETFLVQNVSGFSYARSSLIEIPLNSLSFSSVCSPLLTERRGIAVSCSPGLLAASGEIIRCVPSTPSPWPGRGDGSLCPEPERPQSHEQVSFRFSVFFLKIWHMIVVDFDFLLYRFVWYAQSKHRSPVLYAAVISFTPSLGPRAPPLQLEPVQSADLCFQFQIGAPTVSYWAGGLSVEVFIPQPALR